MDEELKKKILDDVLKTGFATELNAGLLLRKAGWITEFNTNYFDRDSGKSREIDIVATRHFQNDRFSIHASLVIDAKKAGHRPWIIFTPKRDERFDPLPGLRVIHSSLNWTLPILDGDDFSENYMRLFHTSVGTNFHEAFKAANEPSKIYDALISASKAALYQCALNGNDSQDFFDQKENKNDADFGDELIEKEESYDKEIPTYMHVFIPAVVLDGVLCSVTLSDQGTLELQEQEWMPINLSYSSSGYRDMQFFPDIVTLMELPEYLNKVEAWATALCRTGNRNKRHYDQGLS